jgi:uncharacterized cupredoxin-like copper-binding protein
MTTVSFQKHHATMLLKYSGISFISGAVNHGFFSGTRSLWTAAMGIVLFVLGAWLEHRQSEQRSQGLGQALVWGSLLSVGLGFFTGGLQHFPDSPARSAWVVPLGFVLSVLALALSSPSLWRRSASLYVLTGAVLVSAGSWGAYQWLLSHPDFAATGHSHGEASPAEHDASPLAQVVSRSIAVQMDDQMRFTPSTIDVQTGETIRFVVRNTGRTAHEMVLGSAADIQAHAEVMKQSSSAAHDAPHSHGTGAAITVAAGQTGELVVSFPQAVTLQMACLIPGHYEAGMRGTVNVNPAGALTKPSAAQAAAQPAASHDHSGHQH